MTTTMTTTAGDPFVHMWIDPYSRPWYPAPYYPPYPYYPAPAQQGWVCPQCGRSNAPWVASCDHYWAQPWPHPNWDTPTITCSSITIETVSKSE